MTEVFDMIRPHMEFTFYNVLSHINTVFVLRTKERERGLDDSNDGRGPEHSQ